jgi:trimethylamine--corrinoid protein Co-methyltransferase
MAALAHGAARVSGVWGVGSLESEKSISPVKAVMDDEIIGMARRYLRGIEVTEETLAEAVTREVGIAGDFLATDHTFRHFRSEFYEPRVMWRQNRHRWESGGSKRTWERARERAAELMAAERRPTMDEEAGKELRRIEARFLNP